MSKSLILSFTRPNCVIASVMTVVFAICSTVQANGAESGDMTPPAAMATCQEMMQQHAKMMADMKAQDDALSAQVVSMNQTPAGDKRAALMAEIVTQLVTQRALMDERMEQMHTQMAKHMMGHMQMGKESLTQCPMMGGMKDMGGMKEMGGMKAMDKK